jgi:hypothetical protein
MKSAPIPTSRSREDIQCGCIRALLDIINDTRLKAWADQPPTFFEQALLDMDGFLVEAAGQCKQGMDIAYDGTWG